MPTYVPESEVSLATPQPDIDAAPPEVSQAEIGTYRQQFTLLVLLLAFYCIPIFAVAVFAILDIFLYSNNFQIGESLELGLFKVSSDPARYTGAISQMLLPAATAITAFNYKRLSLTGLGSILFILPLAGVFVCIFDALLFDIATDSNPLPGSALAGVNVGQISGFFLTTASSLSAYVLMLVGLKAVEHKEGKEGSG
jgi:hypothetical protein